MNINLLLMGLLNDSREHHHIVTRREQHMFKNKSEAEVDRPESMSAAFMKRQTKDLKCLEDCTEGCLALLSSFPNQKGGICPMWKILDFSVSPPCHQPGHGCPCTVLQLQVHRARLCEE